MIRAALLVLATTLLPRTWAAAIDGDALVARLARPAPASIAFTEVRLSPLLREPLIVSGELSYAGAASLDRHVTRPYREDTAIRGESVRVVREGEPPRSFALKRAPELHGLLSGFSSLLAGDVPGLHRSFDVQAEGTAQSWSLRLVPRDARALRRLQRIEVTGHDDAPRCFTLLNTDGGASVMLLGDAAREPLPADVTLESLRATCEGPRALP
jgi:hypothetical protein